MAQLVTASGRRLWRGLTTWPSRGGWLACAEFSAVALAVIAAIGFATGFYRLGIVNLQGMPLRLLSVIVVPALGEEGVFRGLLLPGESETRRPLLWPDPRRSTVCGTWPRP